MIMALLPVIFTKMTLLFKSLNDTGRSFISFNVHSGAFLPVRLAAIFLEGDDKVIEDYRTGGADRKSVV